MTGDHDAHVQAWRHAAFVAALRRPVSMGGTDARRELVERRVARMSEEQLGGPPVIPRRTGRPGRPVERSQYDSAVDEVVDEMGRRARREHQQEALPALGRAAGFATRPGLLRIVEAVAADRSVKQPVKAIKQRCAAGKVECPSDSTISRLLRRLATPDRDRG